MSPPAPGMVRFSMANTSSTGPNMRGASRSFTFLAASTAMRGRRVIESNRASSATLTSELAIADPPSGALRSRQPRVRELQKREALEALWPRRHRASVAHVDVQQEVLRFRQDGAVTGTLESVEQVQLPFVRRQELRRNLHHVLGARLVQER